MDLYKPIIHLFKIMIKDSAMIAWIGSNLKVTAGINDGMSGKALMHRIEDELSGQTTAIDFVANMVKMGYTRYVDWERGDVYFNATFRSDREKEDHDAEKSSITESQLNFELGLNKENRGNNGRV